MWCATSSLCRPSTSSSRNWTSPTMWPGPRSWPPVARLQSSSPPSSACSCPSTTSASDNLIYWYEALILFSVYMAYVSFMKWNQTVEKFVKKHLYKNKVTRVRSTDQLMPSVCTSTSFGCVAPERCTDLGESFLSLSHPSCFYFIYLSRFLPHPDILFNPFLCFVLFFLFALYLALPTYFCLYLYLLFCLNLCLSLPNPILSYPFPCIHVGNKLRS
ncbi:hypothetical protein FOCC_FOCC002719 [Frankliniella occidentalis]|nr:hypothetical protein FOCC_FOCC002719 [Frankliniella occidentalis]